MQVATAKIALQRSKKKILFTDTGCQVGAGEIDRSMMKVLNNMEIRMQLY